MNMIVAQTAFQSSKLVMLILFWVEFSVLPLIEGDDFRLTSRKPLIYQRY